MKQKKVEILAPAGSFESMKAAVAAGADAVYIGGSRFGARAYADNPAEEKLLEAIDYTHLHGCRLYMTVNTLMKEEEMSGLYEYLLPYYNHGLDAVIVQDMGVFSYVREHFPELPIHASTQMTITGVHGARLMKELGAERVVTARELSLAEIAAIHENVDVEIESFVHGALCYCYSGQCLFSSLIGGRSGNRGRCAQTCRLPYDVKHGGKLLNGKDSRYVLSLKDLCTLDLIPDMIEAGVYSMKIEGRMKSPRYTAGVVEIYRKYTDLCLKYGRGGYRVDEQDRKRLLDLFDRGGQTDGYYRRHNGRDMVVWKEKPAFRESNQELFDYLDRSYVDKQVQEAVTGQIDLEVGQPAKLAVACRGMEVTVLGDIVQEALKQPMDQERIRKQLEKTGNSPFYFAALECNVYGAVFMPIQALNDLRRRGLQELEEALLKPFRRDAAVRDDGKKAEMAGNSSARKKRNEIKLHVSLERPNCIEGALNNRDVSRIYIDTAEFPPKQWAQTAALCRRAGKECMASMPHIFRTEAEQFFDGHMQMFKTAGFDGVLIRSMEEIDFLKASGIDLPMVFDYNLYGMNDRSQRFLLELGAAELTWPVELNSRELGMLSLPGELIVYGRLPMMVTAQCIHQGVEACDRRPGVLLLKDRMGKEFPVKNHCAFCYNTVYNAAPVSLIGLEETIEKLAPTALRLQFTIETPEEMERVLLSFSESWAAGKAVQQPVKEFTRGHFKRGVE